MKKAFTTVMMACLFTVASYAQIAFARDHTAKPPRHRARIEVIPCTATKPTTMNYPFAMMLWGFNMRTFSGCAAYDLAIAGVFSFAMGPAGPAFFFGAAAATLADCGSKAFIPDGGTAQ
jgi:hypothetical protein